MKKIRWAVTFCETFYANSQEGYVEAFHDFVSEKKISEPTPCLDLAPYWEEEHFLFGLQLANGWREEGKIEIPKDSVVYSELTTVSAEDLKENPSTKYPAIEALRFALGAFSKYDFRPVIIRPRRKKGGWMVM